MPQLKQPFDEVRIPFTQMSFTPDVPSTSLGANEYNTGSNVQSDVRGIRSISGEQEILSSLPGGQTPTFITGNFRNDGYFWFVVATDQGRWWANRGDNRLNPTGQTGGIWIEITPIEGGGGYPGYTQSVNITESWNGTVPFFNDTLNPPMFWPDVEAKDIPTTGASGTGSIATLTFATETTAPFATGDVIIVEGMTPGGYNGVHTVTTCTTSSVSFASTTTGAQTSAGVISGPVQQMIQYSNTIPVGIANISFISTTTQRVTFQTAYTTVPYAAGDQIVITGVNTYYNGTFVVTGTPTTTYVDILQVPGAGSYPGNQVGTISPAYSWNYNPNWKSVTAGFVRLYTTPNVGCILVAGNLTATLTDALGGFQETFPVTVQWSQAFGLNQAPSTWTPTVVNVANQLEVPLRGPALDAFPCNGQFFIQSYWDTVVFSPINYSTTSTPILGVRLFNQGRGLLNANCWGNADNTVYGIDARDVWVFDGQNFKGLGNQRVKNYFFDQLDPLYVNRVYMQINTQRNQVEIYYPTVDAINGVPNKMISYRYDLDAWNPPADVNSATYACESPVWTGTQQTYSDVASTTLTGSGSGALFTVKQLGTQYTVIHQTGTGTGYAIGDTAKILGTAVGGATPTNDIAIAITGVNAGQITYITATGTANGNNIANYGSRCIVYARGVDGSKLVQKDQGYSLIFSQAINSEFRRDNIKMLQNYSGKLMVHRILPEIVNLNDHGLEIDPGTAPTEEIGEVTVTIESANSVGQTPQYINSVDIATNTDSPWAQFNQNAYRVNSIVLNDSSNSNIWLCAATTWQFTQVEDDR
jgi:hypothetical protein